MDGGALCCVQSTKLRENSKHVHAPPSQLSHAWKNKYVKKDLSSFPIFTNND